MKGFQRTTGRAAERAPETYPGVVKQAIPFKNFPITVAGATGVGWGTVVIGDLPAGDVALIGACVYVQLTTADPDVQATFAGSYSVGTAPTADATLSGAEANVIPATAFGAATGGVSPVSRGASTAAGGVLNNRDGSLELNLNVLINDASISGAGDFLVSGMLYLAYIVTPAVAAEDGGAPAPAPADPYMIASSRQYLPTLRVQATVEALRFNGSRIEMVSPPYEVRSPRFVWPGFYCPTSNAEANLGNDLPLDGALIEVNGVKTRLTFNGQLAASVPDGGILVNDENDVVIPPNTRFTIAQTWAVPLNSFYLSGSYVIQPSTGDGQGGGGASQLNRLLNGPWGPQPYNAGKPYGPCLMVAKGWAAAGRPPVVLAVGNSIGYGANDEAGVIAPDGVFGYVGRGLLDSASSTRYPFANYCVPGHKYAQLSDVNTTDALGTFSKRKQALEYFAWPFTTVLCEMGINSVSNSVGADVTAKNAWLIAQAKAAHAYLKSLGGRKVVQMTMTPQTTSQSTPGGAINGVMWTSNDPAFQQLGSDAQHVALDNYLTTGSPTDVDAVVDLRPYLQIDSGTGARKWKAPGWTATLQADVAAATNTLTLDIAPQVGDSLVIEAGNTANYEAIIVKAVAGAGPYTVTTKANMTKAHLAGTVASGRYTDDGTHTTQQGARAASQAVIAAKNAGVLAA